VTLSNPCMRDQDGGRAKGTCKGFASVEFTGVGYHFRHEWLREKGPVPRADERSLANSPRNRRQRHGFGIIQEKVGGVPNPHLAGEGRGGGARDWGLRIKRVAAEGSSRGVQKKVEIEILEPMPRRRGEDQLENSPQERSQRYRECLVGG